MPSQISSMEKLALEKPGVKTDNPSAISEMRQCLKIKWDITTNMLCQMLCYGIPDALTSSTKWTSNHIKALTYSKT